MNFFKYRDFVLNESNNFKKSYLLGIDWWSVWKKENESKYDITLNAIEKTYQVADKETGDDVFVYDYDRQKVFTNLEPTFFEIKDDNITPKELTKVADKEKEKIEPDPEKDKEGDKKPKDPLADLGLETKEEE